MLAFMLVTCGSDDEELPPPTFTSINLEIGTGGDEIVITGSNFGRQNNTRVFLDDNEIQSKGVSANRISFNLPTDLPSAQYDIIIRVDNNEIILPQKFNYRADGRWVRRTNSFPGTGRNSILNFVIDNELFFGAGFTNGTQLNDFWSYNIDDDQWTELTSLIDDLSSTRVISAITYTNKGYAITSDNKLFVYDPATDEWDELAEIPTSRIVVASTFTTAEGIYALTQINSELQTWLYDVDNDTWGQKNNFPEFIQATRTFMVNGQILAGVGINSTQLYVYDEQGDVWELIQPVPFENNFFFHLGASTGQYAYLGRTGTGATDQNGNFDGLFDESIYEYLPTTERWIQKASFPAGRSLDGGVSFAYNNKVYYSFGFDGSFELNMWEFDPDL